MSRFVPPTPSDLSRIEELAQLFRQKRCVILTGAGCSTASGIPDYRGPVTGKVERKPMMYQEFVKSEDARRRYWARSAIGWPKIRQARPNDGHRCLAALEASGPVSGVITQNVDGLHGAAGSQEIIELHGRLSEVVCLDCKAVVSRDEVQDRLIALNPGWLRHATGEMAPDGDVEIPSGEVAGFRVPECRQCGGILKPKVVFFGENVAKKIVERAWEMVFDAQALVVLGSSLTVYSGYRFVRGARKKDIPVGIVNLGTTRGDELAQVIVQARVCEALQALQAQL